MPLAMASGCSLLCSVTRPPLNCCSLSLRPASWSTVSAATRRASPRRLGYRERGRTSDNVRAQRCRVCFSFSLPVSLSIYPLSLSLSRSLSVTLTLLFYPGMGSTVGWLAWLVHPPSRPLSPPLSLPPSPPSLSLPLEYLQNCISLTLAS